MSARLPALLLLACGCTGTIVGPRDTGLDLLSLLRVEPSVVLPGTTVVVTGRSFVDKELGASQLVLTQGAQVVKIPLDYVSDAQMQALMPLALPAGLDGAFNGDAAVSVHSTVDETDHVTVPLGVKLTFSASATPVLDAVGDGVSFVNQPTEVTGSGFLLGGGEGETRAVLSGCFQPAGGATCDPVADTEIVAAPTRAFDRTSVTFPYSSQVSGIGPGHFQGTLQLINYLANGNLPSSVKKAVGFDIQPPVIYSASTTKASLGQYVVIAGAGFVGAASTSEATLLALKGTFTVTDTGEQRPLDLELVTEFVDGPTVRYVLDEGDPLGQLVNLRKEFGVFVGTAQPIVVRGRQRVEGTTIPAALQILPIKQVLFVNFMPSYVSSLRRFGLRAIDRLVRARVLAVAGRDYGGVNLEVRDTLPTDFALFSQVDIAGPDPNAQGFFGYDNTPGKDTDNQRLYDRIGGVNATTQGDGYAGFGGVFTDSFFGFSKHPPSTGPGTPMVDDPTSRFDEIFDPFRPDRGGLEVTATELAALSPPTLTSGEACPAASDDRAGQIACAVFVLGNLIGSTMTHEVGHSLGLADPYGSSFHDPGDVPNRLMDAGGNRPFIERVEMGAGPAVFCIDEFDYLRTTLPSTNPAPTVDRPPCD